MTAAGRIALELSCNTQLQCQRCPSQDFRICMEVDEETDEVSTSVVNNVECASCHALYQVRYFPPPADVTEGQNPAKMASLTVAEWMARTPLPAEVKAAIRVLLRVDLWETREATP